MLYVKMLLNGLVLVVKVALAVAAISVVTSGLVVAGYSAINLLRKNDMAGLAPLAFCPVALVLLYVMGARTGLLPQRLMGPMDRFDRWMLRWANKRVAADLARRAKN